MTETRAKSLVQEETKKLGAAFLAAEEENRIMFQRHPTQNQKVMFITTNTQSRVPVFEDSACARIAVETLYSIQHFYPYFLYAFVIMPDHCHFLLKMPEGGSISKMIGIYKRAVSFNIGRGPLWQSRFHVVIPKNIEATINYIHQNPVKAALCRQSKDYSWSSASGRWDMMQLEWM